MGRLLRFRGVAYGGVVLALMFVASSCSDEQSGQTSEEATPAPEEVTREVTKVVTVAEAPKPSEAREGAQAPSEPAPAPKPAPASQQDAPVQSALAYVAIVDGALSIETPSSWGEVVTGEASEGTGASWSDFAGQKVESSITAAPSLDSWSTAPGSPGVYAVTSEALAQRYADEDLVASGPNDLSGACGDVGAPSAFERGPYSGLVQEWGNCGEADGGYLTLAAAPEGRECVVLLQVGTAGQEGEAAGQHVLDTFGADCGALASYPPTSANEQYAEDSEPDPQYTPEDVPLTDQNISNADECAVRGLDFDPESNKCVTPADLEETCTALGKVRAGRGCVFPEDASNVPLTDAEEGTDETEVPELPPGDEERVPPPTDQYEPPEPSPQNPGYEVTDEPSVPGEPPPSSSGYPPFPGDPFNGPTCDEVGGGPYSVPPGSPRDANGDGVACES